MKYNKTGLDEMQTEKRNHIGNQMYFFTFYVLLFDAGLNGMGFHWLSYPINSMIIIILSMSIYLIRVIAGNAYLPPRTSPKRSILSVIIAIVCSITLAVVVFSSLKNPSLQFIEQSVNDNSAIILFVVSAVGLLLSLIAYLIRNKNDKNDSED